MMAYKCNFLESKILGIDYCHREKHLRDSLAAKPILKPSSESPPVVGLPKPICQKDAVDPDRIGRILTAK
jgi:hypothetical protein